MGRIFGVGLASLLLFVLAVALGGWVVMLAFMVLHFVWPAVPALGFFFSMVVSLVVRIVVGVLT